MGKKRGKRIKRKTHVVQQEDSQTKLPKSIVFKSGKVSIPVKELRNDLRNVLEPHTASKLQEKRHNVLKDFLQVAGPLGVSHFIIFSATDFGTYLRLAKFPHGPTLTFRIEHYTLVSDIAAAQRSPHSLGVELNYSPLVVLNNFPANQEPTKLMSILFQGLFPPINVHTVKLSDCKRVVLFSYNKETKIVSFRHYKITINAVGLCKGVKNIIRHRIPKLSNFEDISEFILREDSGVPSDSEVEDDKDNFVAVPQEYLVKNGRKRKYQSSNETAREYSQSAVRLIEIGPRMQLQLIKIEENLCGGKVIYHQYVKKTPEEISMLEKRKKDERKLKEQRRKEQEENINRKKRSKTETDDDADDDDDDSVSMDTELGSEDNIETRNSESSDFDVEEDEDVSEKQEFDERQEAEN